MPTVTLLEKVYGAHSARTFEPFFSSLCKGLKVRLRIIGETERGWIQVEVSGEDETVALNYLDQEVGLAPVSTEGLEKFCTVRGRVLSSSESEKQVLVDLGVFSPQNCDAAVPLKHLQAQLVDGRDFSLQQITELFCLLPNLPLTVKMTSGVESEKKHVEAELSEVQLSQVKRWIRSNLDRLLVLGATLSDVKHTVYASRHGRDVVKVESLGLLEHAVVCKLGTNAVGLTPRFGRFLRDAVLAPFCPGKIQQLVGKEVFW